jgi:hypothetical protein
MPRFRPGYVVAILLIVAFLHPAKAGSPKVLLGVLPLSREQTLRASRSYMRQDPVPDTTTSVQAPKRTTVRYKVVRTAWNDVWECIGHYESNGNYADKSNPNYRGKFQFSWNTWRSVGGSGDPANASPAEQDARARALQQRSGWGQWSTHSLCGV